MLLKSYRAQIGRHFISRCVFCPKLLTTENLFAKLPLIGKFVSQFPVYTCGELNGKLITYAEGDGVPAWCPYVIE